ncbi:MAG: hypothetical protein FJZ56_01205 [Chlamydiae bacterium]|nr:hypothetical protein [Chlamydiota bacterium]
MSYLDTTLKNILLTTFGQDIHLSSQSFFLQNSAIQPALDLISAQGFCPIVKSFDLYDQHEITVVPYANYNFIIAEAKDTFDPLEIKPFEPSSHFSHEELKTLLASHLFDQTKAPLSDKNRWQPLDVARNPTRKVLNSNITKIFSHYMKEEGSFVEIGSGAGYTIRKDLSDRLIRIQPSSTDALFLKTPSYHLTIEEFDDVLCRLHKKVSCFFALNVFDTMDREERQANLSIVSSRQAQGDHLVIILDGNPHIGATLEDIQATSPDHTILPLPPTSKEIIDLSFLRVPCENPKKISETLFLRGLTATSDAVWNDQELPSFGKDILRLKQTINPISFLDFHLTMLKQDLEITGYKVHIYFSIHFEIQEIDKTHFRYKDEERIILREEKPLLLRLTTPFSSMTIGYDLDDPYLAQHLKKTGLSMPEEFDEDFIDNLKKNHQKILGAEVCVVEGTKR